MSKSNSKKILALSLVMSVSTVVMGSAVPALAQYGRKLPKATWTTRAGSGQITPIGAVGPATSNTSSLPVVNGLHLTDGQDRSKGPGPGGVGQPYNPGEPTLKYQLVHWQSAKMPLLIWISPGIKLPEHPFSTLQQIRVNEVTQMLMAPGDPFTAAAGCSQAPGWVPDTNDQVAAGIEQWREFEKEGLFSFAFTDDPHNAHIMVFFVDNFKDSSGPGGVSVAGNTSAEIYPIAQAQSMKIRQKPVIIEVSCRMGDDPQKMQKFSAHEFGHALGIKAHSPYREDIMNENEIVPYLSPSDKATIRYLYHHAPQWVM